MKYFTKKLWNSRVKGHLKISKSSFSAKYFFNARSFQHFSRMLKTQIFHKMLYDLKVIQVIYEHWTPLCKNHSSTFVYGPILMKYNAKKYIFLYSHFMHPKIRDNDSIYSWPNSTLSNVYCTGKWIIHLFLCLLLISLTFSFYCKTKNRT